MGRSIGTLVGVLGVLCSSLIAFCASEGSGYFLFTPPFGGDTGPQAVVASRRSGSGRDVPPSGRSITPSESLWVGSHNINWSPLPLFQRFIEHHQQKKQRLEARKFEAQEQKKPAFLVSGGRLNDPYEAPPSIHQNKPPRNPHHEFVNKFSGGGFFAGLFGKNFAPPPQKFADARSSIAPAPERGNYGPPIAYSPQTQRGPPTTPSPFSEIRSSTGGTILVSPPGTVAVLSTPGPSLSPIVDRLRKMTEWSKQSQKSKFMKKEGTPKNYQERKLRLKKHFRRPEQKQHKHNIEAIILADEENEDTSVERQTHKDKHLPTSKVLKVTSKENVESSEDSPELETKQFQALHRDLVIIHPTNAATLEDPLQVQQSALKSYQIRRQDKQLGIFREENTNYAPVSFRFGAEDAKVNPYA